jgi:hypothetical protein
LGTLKWVVENGVRRADQPIIEGGMDTGERILVPSASFFIDSVNLSAVDGRHVEKGALF